MPDRSSKLGMSRVAVNLPPSKSDTSAWIARRIREAREEAGLTQAELATRLDRTQTSVSYWESGKRVPGIDDLVEVSVAVGKGVHYFLPLEEPRQPVSAILRAETARLASGELDQAVGALLDEAEHAELPERLVTIRSTQPAHAANELIEAALIDGPPVDVHRLAAICGILVLTRKFPDVLSGLILELDHGAIVGINSRHASVRQRFSVGHELGHHLLRHADRFHIDVSDGASPDHDYASERAANEFAAELLMPRRFVARAFHENPNPSSLADLFEVSAIAMGYRLVNLGLR
jgi:Zn-dependent peptidase ImmA (M78 family)/DNA-binding XRE family transcriptional regulator